MGWVLSAYLYTIYTVQLDIFARQYKKKSTFLSWLNKKTNTLKYETDRKDSTVCSVITMHAYSSRVLRATW